MLGNFSNAPPFHDIINDMILTSNLYIDKAQIGPSVIL